MIGSLVCIPVVGVGFRWDQSSRAVWGDVVGMACLLDLVPEVCGLFFTFLCVVFRLYMLGWGLEKSVLYDFDRRYHLLVFCAW